MDKKKIIKVSVSTIVVLGLMLLGGRNYMYNHGLSGKYANKEVKEGQIKVACIGDSITYGHGVENWEKNNYPAQLQELLGEKYNVANYGSSGACVNPNGDQPYINRDVYQASLAYDADIIVFMLGTNDAKPENWNGIDAFMEEYMALLGTYLENGKLPQVYIGLCAEAYFTEKADPSTGIAGFDIQPAVVDEIAERLELMPASSVYPFSVIDIHGLTEAHPEWFEADGIHPNADGAKAMAEAVAEAIQN